MKDLISRASAIDIVRFECGEWEGLAKTIIKRFEQLPSAQPGRKRGKWQEDPSGYGFWICSNCGFVSEASAANVLYNFCPYCGADMREVDDGSD